MLEASKESYRHLFKRLKERGLLNPSLIVSDAHQGLVAAIQETFPGSSWQRCNVHFMRNSLVHVPHREKNAFVSQLKLIWQAPNADEARDLAMRLVEKYGKRFPKAMDTLENGLEDSLAFFSFPHWIDAK